MNRKTDDKSTPFNLRLPNDVKAAVAQESAHYGRTQAGEIVYQLRRAYNLLDAQSGQGRRKPE